MNQWIGGSEIFGCEFERLRQCFLRKAEVGDISSLAGFLQVRQSELVVRGIVAWGSLG
jgi:hypothetical protein